jgi:hypothetical protein
MLGYGWRNGPAVPRAHGSYSRQRVALEPRLSVAGMVEPTHVTNSACSFWADRGMAPTMAPPQPQAHKKRHWPRRAPRPRISYAGFRVRRILRTSS